MTARAGGWRLRKAEGIIAIGRGRSDRRFADKKTNESQAQAVHSSRGSETLL